MKLEQPGCSATAIKAPSDAKPVELPGLAMESVECWFVKLCQGLDGI